MIADKRQAGWLMAGLPGRPRHELRTAAGSTRSTSSPNNYPFVHALDTVSRTAVCIGLPWEWVAGTARRSGGRTLTLDGATP